MANGSQLIVTIGLASHNLKDSDAGVETECPNRCGNNQCCRASSVNLEVGSVNGGVESTNREGGTLAGQ